MRLLICFLLAATGWTQTGIMRVLRRPAAVVAPPSTNLVFWYRGDSLTCTGGCTGTNVVTVLVDKSASANNCTTTGSPTFVASALNAQPGMTFASASSQYCTFGSAIDLKTSSMVFAVLKMNTTAAKQYLLGGNFRSLGYGLNRSGYQFFGWVGSDESSHGTAAADTSWHQINMSYDNTTATFRMGSAADGAPAPSETLTGTDTVIGQQGSGATFLDGTVTEILIYNTINLTTKTAVESYLNARYGI